MTEQIRHVIMRLRTDTEEHRCMCCKRRIPPGERFWQRLNKTAKMLEGREHTNCVLYEDQPEMRYSK